MIRVGTLFWFVLVSATAFAMFGVKYQVQALDDELARTKRVTAAEEHETRVLDAEWAYLTRPEMLETMNHQFLSLAPISTKQLRTTVADIPMRPALPAPPPPTENITVVAAADSTSPTGTSSAPEGVPTTMATPIPITTPTELPPTQSALRAMPALLEKSAGAPQVVKAVPVKAVAKPATPRRAKSLDDLISQIMASR